MANEDEQNREIREPDSPVIPLENVLEGMEIQSDMTKAYVSKTTGELVFISDEELSAIDAGEKLSPLTDEPLDKARAALESDDYIEVPDRFDINEYDMMARFANTIEDEAKAYPLSIALRGRGAFRRFKDCVHEMNIADQWYEFRNREFERVAIEWCEFNGIKYSR